MNKSPLLVLALSLSLGFFAAWPLLSAPPKSHRIQVKGSRFEILVFKSGLASALAHDHVVQVKDFKGQVKVNRAKPERSQVSLTVLSKSLHVLKKSLSKSNRAKVEKTMKSAKILNVQKYPKVTLSSKSLRMKTRSRSKGLTLYTFDMTAELSLHGQSRTIVIPVRVEDRGKAVIADGQVDLKQSDFGITPYSAFLGAIGVKDSVTVKFRIETQSP